MKRIIKITVLILIFNVMSFSVSGMSRNKNDREVEKIEKEVINVNENIFQGKYKVHTIIMDRDIRAVGEDGEIKYYTENGKLKKIITYDTVDNDTFKGKWIQEYYIKESMPYYWKSYFIPSDKGTFTESRFYYKFEDDGTFVGLFRIVKDGKIDDGENEETFRGSLRDYSSILYVIEENMKKK